jgi:N-acyl homoserine lactone hydrolase
MPADPPVAFDCWAGKQDWAGDLAVRLAILDFGLFRVVANGRVIGIPGYLVFTASGRNILIDTGFPPAYAADASAASARDGLLSFGEVLRMTARNLPEAQLATLGLGAADIDLVILTHGDIDHVGNLERFAHAPVLVGQAERALPRPRYFGDVRPLDWPGAAYVTIDADTPLCRGLTILSTPGHSPGHLSVLLDLPHTGRVILTADAISRPSEPDEGMKGSWDEAQALVQARRLQDMAADGQGMLVYGHCPVQWPALRKAPEVYD